MSPMRRSSGFDGFPVPEKEEKAVNEQTTRNLFVNLAVRDLKRSVDCQ